MTISCSKLRGEFSRAIIVTTNDPNHARETLTCKGRILEPVNLNPKRLSFGQVSRKASAQTKKVIITRGDGGPLALKLVPIELQGFGAQLREIEPGERYELEVTLTPPLKSNRVRTNLKLETGLAEVPTITIPASATQIPRVVAQPRRFSIPAQRDSDFRQAVRLIWDDDAEHKILSVSANDPGLKVSLSEEDGKQEVVLEVSDGYKPRSGARTVTVTTDDTEVPTIRVPVIMARRARTAGARSFPRAARSAIEAKANKDKVKARKTRP